MTNIEKMLNGKILTCGSKKYRYNEFQDCFESYSEDKSVWFKTAFTLKELNSLNMEEVEEKTYLSYSELIKFSQDNEIEEYERLVFEWNGKKWEYNKEPNDIIWFTDGSVGLSLSMLLNYAEINKAKARLK